MRLSVRIAHAVRRPLEGRLVPAGTIPYFRTTFTSLWHRLRLCSCADAIADPIPDCGANGHADRQRCALAGSHAVGQRSSRVLRLLQARSMRLPSRRFRARPGRGAARRAQ